MAYILRFAYEHKWKIIVALVFLTLIIVGGIYVWISERTKAELTRENATQALRIKQLELVEKKLRDDAAALSLNLDILYQSLQATHREAEERKKVFADHDLRKIGSRKPTLLENRINKATKDTFKRIEQVTRQ